MKHPYEIEFISVYGKITSWVRFSNNIENACKSAIKAYYKEFNMYPKYIKISERNIEDFNN